MLFCVHIACGRWLFWDRKCDRNTGTCTGGCRRGGGSRCLVGTQGSASVAYVGKCGGLLVFLLVHIGFVGGPFQRGQWGGCLVQTGGLFGTNGGVRFKRGGGGFGACRWIFWYKTGGGGGWCKVGGFLVFTMGQDTLRLLQK